MGVVSNYDWGSMAGVPETLEDSTLPAGYTTGVGSVDPLSGHAAYDVNEDFLNSSLGHDGNSVGFNPDDPNLNIDFSIIGDMLDLTAGEMNMDWEMWDSQITSAQQVSTSSQDWPDLQSGGNLHAAADNAKNMRWGNAPLGGSGALGNSGTIPTPAFQTGTGPLDSNLWLNGLDASTAAAAAAEGGSGVPRGPSTIAWGGGGENIWGIDFGTEDSGANATGGGESMGAMDFVG